MFLSLVLTAVVSAQTASAPKRLIAETDVLNFIWSTDPEISADRRNAAFTRVGVNEKKEDYETPVWVAATDGKTPPRRFTAGPRDSGPRFSPDGIAPRLCAGRGKGRQAPTRLVLSAPDVGRRTQSHHRPAQGRLRGPFDCARGSESLFLGLVLPSGVNQETKNAPACYRSRRRPSIPVPRQSSEAALHPAKR